MAPDSSGSLEATGLDPRAARPHRWPRGGRRALAALAALLVATLAASAAADRSHTVRPGQTLVAIARSYRVDVQDLAAANRLRRGATLRPGQTLAIPDAGVVYVRPGDNLRAIAGRHEVTVAELRRVNRLRGDAVRVGQRLVLPGHVPSGLTNRSWGAPERPGRVTVLRRGVRTTFALVDDAGRVRRDGLQALGDAMKRHDDDPDREPNPRLALLLAKLSDSFGGRPISVVSGFRQAGGSTAESSRHTDGRAADIRIADVPHRALWERCRALGHVGCGYYPRSTFVHVDARRARAQWVDWAGPGQRARYGTLRGPVRDRARRLSAMPLPRQRGELPLVVEVVESDGSVTRYEDRGDASADEEPEPEDVDADPV